MKVNGIKIVPFLSIDYLYYKKYIADYRRQKKAGYGSIF